MTAEFHEESVFVEAPARLHFGVMDLRGGRGRWFGGIGAAAPTPRLLVVASPSRELVADGNDAARAVGFARRVLDHYGLDAGVRLRIDRSLPAHVGLGSGTQLALAVARALAELYQVGTTTAELVRAVGRARRSAIGTYAFDGGGLVLEGGRREGSPEVAPLLARMPFPRTWRCVVVVPSHGSGISGSAERDAFDRLPAPPEREVERVAHLVLMGLLPALAEADLDAFGDALNQIQRITGRWWAPVQGGPFMSRHTEGLVEEMIRLGAVGAGQSSWGPAVYGLVEGETAGLRLAACVRDILGAAGCVYEGPFPIDGARVWRGSPERASTGAVEQRPEQATKSGVSPPRRP